VSGLQRIGQLRNEAREKELAIKEKEQFHEAEVANNKEVEKKISVAERTCIRVKQELQDAERLRDTFNSEVSTLPITTDSAKYCQKLHFKELIHVACCARRPSGWSRAFMYSVCMCVYVCMSVL